MSRRSGERRRHPRREALERQAELRRSSKDFVVVVTEAALRTKIGSSETMRAQLARVIEMSALPNVRVGVITLVTEVPVIPHNSFCIRRAPVTAETMTAEMLRESRDSSYLRRSPSSSGRRSSTTRRAGSCPRWPIPSRAPAPLDGPPSRAATQAGMHYGVDPEEPADVRRWTRFGPWILSCQT